MRSLWSLRPARQRRRWVVERTFSWFSRNRRLARDYETLADTLLAFVMLASIQLALRQTRAWVGF